MKILFLHLSDLHIKNSSSYSDFHIKKMIDSLRVAGSFDKMIIIFSGDIAFSGDRAQYNVANGIINKISTELSRQKMYCGEIEVVCVPGNHDIQYETPARTAQELNQIFSEYTYAGNIDDEFKKQEHFFRFAKKFNCFTDNNMFSRRILDLSGFKVEVNMINSGVFSLKSDEDKGLHYIDQNSINKLNTPTGADFVVTVMHHAYHWYTDAQKEQLEKALLCKSSLIFLGHEHISGSKKTSYDDTAFAFVHAGGALCNGDDWTKSEYEFSVLDTESFTYSVYLHKWDTKENQYIYSTPIVQSIPSKPSVEKRLRVCDEYNNKILSDPLRNLATKFTDYFVFPRIETDAYGDTSSKEFLDIDVFLNEIGEQKRVIITGANGCGKTSLLKALFIKLAKDKCVIYCDIDTIKNKASSKIVKSNFEEIYGEDYASYVRYQQLAPENKVLIIDDIDQIRPRDFDQYVSSISNEFGLMIFATKKVIDLDILDRMKNALKMESAIAKYKITPFYSDKRQELVRKIVEIKHRKDATIEIDEITDKLCEAIKLQKKYISLTPDFIIDFVDYYCNNIGTVSNSDSTVFSKVFEANITSILSSYQSGVLTTDKIYRLLSMTAYHIHFNKKYPIPEDDILGVVKAYNEKNDDEVKPSAFFNIIKNCKILVENENGYKFANKNQLAYFIAREVNFLYNQTGKEEDLTYLLKNACFGINADVLMFISYITDNTRILGFLLSTTQALTADWGELNLETNLPKFLELHTVPELSAPNNDSKNEADQKEIAKEKETDSQLATVDIYDYDESNAAIPINQIIRGLSLLMIISKCLPSFEHNMDADMRRAFVQEIYSLPNKIYHIWAQETEKDYDQIIRELRQEGPTEYEEDRKPGELNKLQVEFQIVAMTLLLDIYNISAAHATKDNSFRLLDKFDRGSNATYQIQHLMMLEKQKASEQFVTNAISMYDGTDNTLIKLLTQIVVRHAMIYMKALDYKKRDQLKSSFFKSRQEQKNLLAKRAKKGNYEE